MLRERQYREYMDEFAGDLAIYANFMGLPDEDVEDLPDNEDWALYFMARAAREGVERSLVLVMEYVDALERHARN